MPALIQRLSVSQTYAESEPFSAELRGVATIVLRLHSDLLWEKVREAGRDASESKVSYEQRKRLFTILRYADLPEDELAPHAACVVDALQTFGARTDLDSTYCVSALGLMSRMPPAVIEEHIGSVMLVLNLEDVHYLHQKCCLDVIEKLTPEKLASLNLKPQIQIAAISLAKSNIRSQREQVAKLLKTIPD